MTAGEGPQLLTTKVRPPRSPPGLIDRPRLLQFIDQAQTKRLTVVRGGAGFGKTSLLLAFANRLGESDHMVAWLSLDPDDNDAARFLRYVAQALQRAGVSCAAVFRLISDMSLVAPATIVASLVNELAETDEDIFLMIDDYHTVGGGEVQAIMAYLLRYAPSQLHFVLATRIEPALPLAALRAQNQLLEIDADALRFDADETRRVLEHERIAVVPADAKAVRDKTEGWPALLRILISTLKPGQDLARRLERISGIDRPIGAYLAEMLDGLPADLVASMMRTAIVDRFSASLAQAVTGAKSGEELLETLGSRQLLLAPLDQEGRWVRYHPLLAEYLSERLERELADEIPWLHRRAYRWYAAQGLWTEAVRHSIAAGDTDQALGWIKNCAMDLVKQGDLLTLMDWQRLFPMEIMRSQLEVRLALAWGMALAMRFDEALALATELEDDMPAESAAKAELVSSECATIRSVALALKDDSEAALAIAEDCLRRSSDPWTANVASNVARLGRLKAGDLEGFYSIPWIPYSDEENRRNLFASVYRRCLLGIAEAQQLRLGTAERHYVEGMQLAEGQTGVNSIAAALPASLLAEIRYQQGRLDEADALVLDRVPLIYGAAMLECVLRAGLVLSRIAEWRGNLERAYALLEQIERLGSDRHWDRLVAAALAERVRMCLAEDRIVEGGACLDRLDQLASRNESRGRSARSQIRNYARLARAQLTLAKQRPKDCAAQLSPLLTEAEEAQDHYFALRVTLQMAIASASAHETAQATTMFRRVVSKAALAGISQTILEQGPSIGPLLVGLRDNLQRSAESPDLQLYLQNLLSRWRGRFQSASPVASGPSTVGSLSARERRILEIIGEGKSNKEIARVLDITPETVKSHVKNIFVKLAVEKRAQAVVRAQSIGLVRTY
jgi:LuxR family transcriptional regulator, maltose regulon positive regulatory protein